jgi:hypothetical protein
LYVAVITEVVSIPPALTILAIGNQTTPTRRILATPGIKIKCTDRQIIGKLRNVPVIEKLSKLKFEAQKGQDDHNNDDMALV